MSSMKAIETTNLTKYYGKSRGIIDVNLAVDEGDFFGFIGPNGAGKSTTIRTLLGFISATGGTAKVLGHDILKDKTTILSNIGYLPSETIFYPNMKVQDVLTLSARLHKKDCTAEGKILCDRLELDTSKKIEELSYGNRKKVGIVCALQHSPELYILDEPTGGLDPLMQREFYSILKERNENGATVFLSSHILSEVARYCKHAAVIREGELLVTDRVANLGHTGVKHVTLRGISHLPDIENVRNIKIENDTMTFLYSGKPDMLLKELTSLSFDDITITDPDLEEIFMHYYMKGAK